MERTPSFIDQENKYSKNGHTTKGNIQFSAMPIKISMPFFTEVEKTIPKLVWKHKRLPNTQSNPKQKERQEVSQ
jgi:hypothetical protein